MPAPVEVVVHDDAQTLGRAVAERLAAAVATAQQERGAAAVVLTGGGMGGRVLAALAEAGSRPSSTVDWSALDLWWGDERFVPSGDPERNETQAREVLLDHVDVDPARVHPMPASDGPDGDDLDAAAARHADELAAAARATGVAGPVPVFDVLVLGVGPDGHVASLFPGLPAVEVTGTSVIGVTGSPKPPPLRTSLTLPVINGAEQVWCVVSGAEKADAVARALSEEGRSVGDLPASRVSGTQATLWLLDADAASGLPASSG